MTYSGNVIKLLDSDSVMEDDLIGNLLSEGEGWKCMAHYNSLCSIYKSVYSSLKNKSCTSINKLLEASFLLPNSVSCIAISASEIYFPLVSKPAVLLSLVANDSKILCKF